MSNPNSNTSKNFLRDFLSGGVAGAIAKTTAAPIERVKLLLQTQHTNEKIKEPFTGIIDCFSRTIKNDGFRSLWRGNMANVIRYFPTQALNFSFKDYFHTLFLSPDSKSNPYMFLWGNVMSGGCAGAISTMFVYPLDFARTRLGVDIGRNKADRQFTGIFDCVGKVYRTNGIVGLYRGIDVAMVGIFLYRGLYFGLYDTGKGLFLSGEKKISLFQKFLFAQMVVMVSESISYPTDTVKRRLMMQSARSDGLIKYTGSIDCARKMIAEEGPKAFFKGNLSNIFRGLGSSLCLVLYDEFQTLSRKY